VRELKGFQRVSLAPGEAKTVTLHLDTNELGFWSAATHRFGVEASTYDVWVGDSSDALENHATFELTK
jgi:beta-glucosidase